jgi:hypothetical protein
MCDQVVVETALRAEPSRQHTPLDLLVGQEQVDHAVDVVALEEELGLGDVAREAVDTKP